MGRLFGGDRDGSHYIAVLKSIRHVYIALHQDTDCAPRAFSASTTADERVLSLPSSYPQCNIPRNIPHPASLAQDPVTYATAQITPHLQQRIPPPIASGNAPLFAP